MKKAVLLILGLMMSAVLPIFNSTALAATDWFYNLSETTYTWDGTDADRTKAPTADYDYNYGDEASLTYNLPWSFNYYGQAYSSISIDSNGNIWFANSSPAHSYNLQNTGRGPVIAAWNNDLSSQYYGGFFVQHKTNPERVVIEWQTETYSEEGGNLINNFEVVLYQSGVVRFDYNSFSPDQTDDFGSGMSRGDNTFYNNVGTVYNLANRSFITSLTSIPFISVNPPNANIDAKLGSSAIQTYIVTNIGSGELQINSAGISGVDSSLFTKITDTCSGSTLGSLQTCSIQVSFTSATTGVKSAVLSISSNDPNNGTANIPLVVMSKVT